MVLNIEWMQFVLKDCEILHSFNIQDYRSTRGLLISQTVQKNFQNHLYGHPVLTFDKRQICEEILKELPFRSEEHTSELQSPPSISYAVFCLKKKTKKAKGWFARTQIYWQEFVNLSNAKNSAWFVFQELVFHALSTVINSHYCS